MPKNISEDADIGDELFAEVLELGHNTDASLARMAAFTPYELDAYIKAADRAMGPARTEVLNETHANSALAPADQALWDRLVQESAPAPSRSQKAPAWN